MSSSLEFNTELQTETTCPNCWFSFPPEEVLWIAAHESLQGDPKLGPDFPSRFLPSRFDIAGNAIDVRGMTCQDIACPNCHVRIPRSTLFYRPLFISIAGTPSCGKSFFLASMCWQLRKKLGLEFEVSFTDSDGECNQILNSYEEQLFFSKEKGRMVKLAKTDATAGQWYNFVMMGNQRLTFPKPFYFDLAPSDRHQVAGKRSKHSRLLCLYDNAGESYLPGIDSVNSNVTRHLGLAESWMFCFDPTQDPRVRNELRGKSDDVQVTEGTVTMRQDTVLNEMINRIRRLKGMSSKDRTDLPLIVVCTKFDAWKSLLGDVELKKPWSTSAKLGHKALNLDIVNNVSAAIRKLFSRTCPEVVASSTALSSSVYFIPISATGVSPVFDPKSNAYMIPADDINPIWCEVPLLLALSNRAPKLIFSGQSKKDSES